MTRTSSLIRPRTAIVAAIAVAGILVVAGLAALATRAPAGMPPLVSEAVHYDTSAPLATIPDTGAPGRIKGACKPADQLKPEEINQTALAAGECPPGYAPTLKGDGGLTRAQKKALYPRRDIPSTGEDPVVQTTNRGPNAPATLAMPSTAQNWQGVGVNGSAPPDTSLDVSATQVVQAVNSSFQVWNKTGTSLYGPVSNNTLWLGFGGLCETHNDGDPTVQYDRLANRWVLSQFAVSTGAATMYQCVAVSQTSDATGAWYRYAFAYAGFPDYPKLAVWPDAYYTTFNMFNSTATAFTGANVCAYDRAAMLAGTAATQICFNNASYGGILVAGIEGATAPAAGTAAYAIALNTLSSMAVWRFHVDFATPGNSTWIQQSNAAVASFAQPPGTGVPQLGSADNLDDLGDRLMYRFVYRKIGTTESLLVSHTVYASSLHAVRWYEFRPSGSTLTTYQQGTFQPDTLQRWMPSIAMDGSGNIAVGYSVSSSAMNPAIRYAGRLSSDTLGTLGQGEATLFAGTGSQIGTSSRWGDYTAIAVDPADDCTFWISNEYYSSTTSFGWLTRIGSFKFPSCGTGVPSVSSFTSAVPTPTKTTSIDYALTFSETVTGIDAGDFSNAGTATGCTFTPSAASGSSVTLTVTTCSTTGTLQPQIAANSVTNGGSVTGPAGASAAATTLTLDRVAPTVSSFTSAVSTPTNSTSIAYTLTFSESVTGIAAGDFSNAGTATGCTFTPSAASGSSVTVTVTTCSTTGTLQPQLALGSIADPAGNTGPASASAASVTLTLDRVLPTVSAFTSAVGSPTNATSIAYSLTLSENVTGLAAGDFNNAGTATGCTFSPSAATATGGTPITLTITNCGTSGTLQPRLAANGVTDSAGNTGPASASAATITLTLDRVAPSVSAFTSAVATPTNSTSIVYSLTFAESVTGIAAGDFANAGTATGCTFTPSAATATGGTPITVTVTTCSTTGTLQPRLAIGSVTDAVGNTGPAAAATATTTLTLDGVAPTVASITPAASATNAASTTFTVTFSESVTGVAGGNFSLTTTGSVSGASVSGVIGSGATRTVTVSTGSGDGTIRLDLSSASPSIADAAGNALSATFSGGTAVTVDKTAPSVTSFASLVSTPTNSTSIAYTLTLSESVTGIVAGDFSNAGTATGCTFTPSGSGASYTVTATTCSTTGTLQPQLVAGGVSDLAGNTGPASAASATTTLTLDRVAPAVSSIVPSVTLTNAASVTFTVTFSESVTGVAAGNFSLTASGSVSGASVLGVTGSGAARTVTVSTGSGDGTIRLDLSSASPAISDAAANSLAATFSAGTAVTVDMTAPSVAVVPNATLTNAATIDYSVTFSESVTGLQIGDFGRTGTATGCVIGAPSGSGSSYTVLMTGCSDGTVTLSLNANTVTDAAANTGPTVTQTADTVTRDASPPTTVINAPTTPTNAATLTYDVVFNESVTGLTAADLARTGTATGCVVGSPAGAGAAWTVDVTGCSEGTVVLALNTGTVTDAASNTGPLAIATATTVVRDTTAPTAVITAPATPTGSVTLSYDITFSKAVTGLEALDIVTGGGTATGCAADAPTGSGTAWTVTLSGCSVGTVTFGLLGNAVTDQAGNTGPATQVDADMVTVIHDPTNPTFSQAIAVALRAGSSLATASTTSAIPVLITWAAADDAAGSGLDHYTLDRSTDGGATWLTVTPPALLAISYPTTMPTSGTVRYRVTAYDVMGNLTVSQTASLSPRIIQQSSSLVKYSGIWYAYKAASLSGTTLKWSRTASAYATYTFTGRGIGFVAIKGIGRGSVKVYLDGKYKGQVSLYKTGAGVGRLLAWQSGTLTLGKHTIKLIVAGTAGHPRVDLDAFIVMK